MAFTSTKVIFQHDICIFTQVLLWLYDCSLVIKSKQFPLKLINHHSRSWGEPECVEQDLRASTQQFLKHFKQNHRCEPHGGARGKVRASQKSLMLCYPIILCLCTSMLDWICVFFSFFALCAWWKTKGRTCCSCCRLPEPLWRYRCIAPETEDLHPLLLLLHLLLHSAGSHHHPETPACPARTLPDTPR